MATSVLRKAGVSPRLVTVLEARDLGAFSSAVLDDELRILDAEEIGVQIRARRVAQ